MRLGGASGLVPSGCGSRAGGEGGRAGWLRNQSAEPGAALMVRAGRSRKAVEVRGGNAERVRARRARKERLGERLCAPPPPPHHPPTLTAQDQPQFLSVLCNRPARAPHAARLAPMASRAGHGHPPPPQPRFFPVARLGTVAPSHRSRFPDVSSILVRPLPEPRSPAPRAELTRRSSSPADESDGPARAHARLHRFELRSATRLCRVRSLGPFQMVSHRR